mmetsp:Transcript_117771/g.293682  ORF Transcript_117771/g.293682 Transcript_117771/m.293682 type:complete len:384 (+) Transcript_117771:66-1217(+)
MAANNSCAEEEPEVTGGSGEEEEALEAHVRRLLLAHRSAFAESCKDEGFGRDGRRKRRRVLKRPFEVLEMAYQAASQIMVALLVPKVHPVVPALSRCLLRRDYPEVLACPCLAVFVSGLHAKLALDTANLCGFIPFRWVEPRPPRRELLHPLSPRGLELNLVGSVAGVCIGKALVALRRGLRCAAEALIGKLPASTRQGAAVILHLTASGVLAPMVVGGLTASLREAQLRGRPLLPVVAVRFLSWVSTGLAELLSAAQTRALADALEYVGLGHVSCGGAGQLLEVPWWDGVEEDSVPRDLICPITGGVFVRPVALHGMVFEESAARRWVEASGRHPVLQGVWCHVGELQPARDIEALCRQLASERGWVLQPVCHSAFPFLSRG